MLNVLEHKGYIATIELDEDAGNFHGEVINTRAVLTFVGNSLAELRHEFSETIAVYEELCRDRGEAPEKPYSGSFMLRLSPELHRRAAETAIRTGKSLNSFVKDAVEDRLSGGQVRIPGKTRASRESGRLGGRPKKKAAA